MFEELKVLELASVLAGPSVGQFFAELGAEVIKVENIHTAGDVTRTWRIKGERTDDRSSYFCAVNWGKKSIVLDLNTGEGREIIYALVRNSDIVIASFKSGDAAKLGVDYATLSSVNPQLIYGQITGYGPTNPRVGYDAAIQAEAGFMFMNGEPNHKSLKMPVALMDILAAHHLKEGILLALLNKQKTKRGEFIEVSLIQAAISSLANQATNWLVAGIIPEKQGSAHPNIAPYGEIFRTSDGHELLLSIGSDKQFQSLCRILGVDEFSRDAAYQTNESRVRNREVLNLLLSKKIESFDAQFLIASFTKAHVPYGIVRNMQQVFDSPEAYNLLLQSADRIGVKTYVGTSLVPRTSHILPPPHLGEHSKEILLQTLEISEMEIKSLIERGIIG